MEAGGSADLDEVGGARFALREETDDYVVTQAWVAAGLRVVLLPRLALTAFRDPRVHVVAADPAQHRELFLVHHCNLAGVDDSVSALVRALHEAAGQS
ncbi:hypothetical protein ACWDKQ_27040 [Saccharopolyspora sp. NPDC000995]